MRARKTIQPKSVLETPFQVTVVFMRHSRQAKSLVTATYWDRCYRSVVCICLFVCLSVMFVHCAQTAEDTGTISFAYEITLKFGLHWSTSSSPYFATKWPTPVDLIIEAIQWQIVAEWLEIVQPSLFPVVPSLTAYDVPLPIMGVQMHPPGPTLRYVLPPGEYDRRYRQAMCCARCHYNPSDVAFCI